MNKGFGQTAEFTPYIRATYFGLLPDFIGCGLGKHLLTSAVERAWATGANRIWVHTCTLDHPAAMPNYLKRGFQLNGKNTLVMVIALGS